MSAFTRIGVKVNSGIGLEIQKVQEMLYLVTAVAIY